MARFTNIGLHRKNFVQSAAQEESSQRAAFSAERADARRFKRAEEREVNTTCFACRGTGHAARDCPNILAAAEGANGSAAMLEADELARKAGLVGDNGEESGEESEQAAEDEGKKDKTKGKGKKEKLTGGQVTGGKCYRCNSSAHSLHHCPAPVDPENPTPFATCFVCLGSGHLSAGCPKNPRGVYVNGGACKICHSVAHRAKDCPTQRPEPGFDVKPRGRPALVLGTGEGAGADEDDFMVTRRTATPGEAKGTRAKHLPAKNSARGPAKRPGEEGWFDQDKPVAKKKKVVSF
ncbi:hypothetical protein CcaverHIS002_0204540 [Cutaneotrichosporon cavernicola]|uniref:CCHC-type domain-containing protein n=1 Tax=Cutaneotrichosporon cavernicola TaxID=279322 RepID=A0AA48IIF6_9TREE|nr:uncharacterized protein CcaverHIS019_0204500 [Cutaneotrichosporon cavernicola]BEI81294.1 hypothetical protein CcaverHIS002_0204540 [Cutaneotrichosporon cavernicola]BEI89088.1 hypothetical protein CcaverHIS019_0204500 [Cutaneotrichosporon cavernicola]BEI96864.1 hypothetical protein CcaverHIS631_0204530 [Cutaneotrichosporon cavernicola]BEJ04636.1 hypothetical protein CcaverHIS641_0204530 [Cutaneotrichosporon cavernicola]